MRNLGHINLYYLNFSLFTITFSLIYGTDITYSLFNLIKLRNLFTPLYNRKAQSLRFFYAHADA